MAVVVTAKSGYDLGYVWKGQAQAQADGERTAGGYYLSAAQAGEPPGRWFGAAAAALGFAAGQTVERAPYEAVYRQVDPRDGGKLGNAPGGYAKFADHLARLTAAEPHATSERFKELERQAAQATRKSPAYTDVTVSISKSVSVFHASLRENGRRARLAGDEAAAVYWQAREGEYQDIVQAANRAGLEYLERWAVTRTGHHGARVDGQEPGRYEDTGLVVTSWLQGTSRDGDPQDHVHNQIARMTRTRRDGKWRALDTMSVRAQLGAVQAIVSAHLESALSRRFGVQWVARTDGIGNEIAGVTQAQMDAYSTRTQTIQEQTPAAVAQWTAKYGRAPNRRELLHIQNEVTMSSRHSKDEGAIDWDALTAHWDQTLGGELAQIAPNVSDLGGADAATPDDLAPREPSPDAQARAMQIALACVQEKHSTWTRADLLREMAACLPAEARTLAPADAVTLLHDLADRVLAGETQQVACLDAPEWPPLPAYLRRDLDGRSVYTRPGTARYATHLQISREEQLLAAAQREGAPALAAETSAEMLGADPMMLEHATRTRAQEATAQLPSGLRVDQAAALHHALTSSRTVSLIAGPAGSGKTHVLARAAHMWPGDVIGLAPSQAARNVLHDAADIETYNTAQFLGHTKQQRGALGPMALRPGTLVLLDEGSMTSLADVAAIVTWAAKNRCKVIITGDHRQLTAVEGGGGMALLARRQEHALLADPVRFTARWEREASLGLRTGDASVLTRYDQHGRIHGGTEEQAMEDARKAYVANYLTGADVLLIAQSKQHCRELSQQIREDLQHLGLVDRGREAELRAGARASVGDLIIIKENDHLLGVANGDTFRIEAIREHGVIMRKVIDCDRETGERQFADHTVTYRDCRQSAELAYAVTGHSAQGRTVSRGMALITGSEDREWAYVALSRGADRNDAYVSTESAKVADPELGTRPAPELERNERISQERAGLPGLPEQTKPDVQAREPIAVLSDVLERTGAEVSALEVERRNLANADHLGRLHVIWQGETKDAIRARHERSLRVHLPEPYRNIELGGTSTWLWRTLRAAEAAGLDAEEVLSRAIESRPLEGTRDVAAVLDSRIRESTGTLVPLPARPWVEQIPQIEDVDRRDYVIRLAAAMDHRTERLGEFTAEAPPPWAVQALGPVPQDPLDHLEWEQRASHIAAYRELFGWDHPAEPIGPEPDGDAPEKRAAWHAAFAELGPVNGVDVRKEQDGRLLHMRDMYQAETAWAPRWVGDELRQVRMGADEAVITAIRSDAEAAAARERGDQTTSARHEMLANSYRALETAYRGYGATFADTMDARAEWERATQHTRHLAVAADSEYRRRHPDVQLEPLRSAEPPRPAEDEHRTLAPDNLAHQTPAWVTELAERNRMTREKLDERRNVMVPAQDHEWEDEGEAWPEVARVDRDAILQPPKPEIRPVPQLAERTAVREEPELEAGG